jgi:hypothetical protein
MLFLLVAGCGGGGGLHTDDDTDTTISDMIIWLRETIYACSKKGFYIL